MLKRLMLIALPLSLLVSQDRMVVGQKADLIDRPPVVIQENSPTPLTDAQRADYALAVARVAIAQATEADARARMLEAQAQRDALTKALRERIEQLRKASGAANECELNLEGHWKCASDSR